MLGNYLPPGTQINALTAYRSELLLVTSTGQYRLGKQNQVERLPLPILQEDNAYPAEDGDVYLWDGDTVICLPR